MVTRRVKPTSPGRRFQSYASFEEITKKKPEKNLLRIIKKSGGRNANGRIPVVIAGVVTSDITGL